MPFDAEDFARTALLRLIPRGRYRIAAPNDVRFASFAPECTRVAYRQQGAQPSFVLFMTAEQDPRPLATAAAEWAAANWRPNAVQKRVQPGVVAVQIGPGQHLAGSGAVLGTAVPAVVWTVDTDSGRVTANGGAPGAPSSGEMRNAAANLARGLAPPALGELDYAERNLMHPPSTGMPTVLTGGIAILLVLFAFRFGFSALLQALAYAGLLGSGQANPVFALAGLVLNALLVAGIVFGVALLVNFGNFAMRAPGFSSSSPQTRTASWVAFGVVMALLVAGANFGLPRTLQSSPGNHVSAVASDDGSQVQMAVGGDVRVDLRGWPSSEWSRVTFKTSNPSVLVVRSAPSGADIPVATFGAVAVGTSRIDAASHDGRFSFELRVTVVQ